MSNKKISILLRKLIYVIPLLPTDSFLHFNPISNMSLQFIFKLIETRYTNSEDLYRVVSANLM